MTNFFISNASIINLLFRHLSIHQWCHAFCDSIFDLQAQKDTTQAEQQYSHECGTTGTDRPSEGQIAQKVGTTGTDRSSEGQIAQKIRSCRLIADRHQYLTKYNF